ncbi:hypothetical protein K2X33_14170, partial [bacterium]|nr:hypothetical protein [bacterium]
DLRDRAGDAVVVRRHRDLFAFGRQGTGLFSLSVRSRQDVSTASSGLFKIFESEGKYAEGPEFEELAWWHDELLPMELPVGKQTYRLSGGAFEFQLRSMDNGFAQVGFEPVLPPAYDLHRPLRLMRNSEGRIWLEELGPHRKSHTVPLLGVVEEVGQVESWDLETLPLAAIHGRPFLSLVPGSSKALVWGYPSALLTGRGGVPPTIYLWSWATGQHHRFQAESAFGSPSVEALEGRLGDITSVLILSRPAWAEDRAYALAATQQGTLIWLDLTRGRFLGETSIPLKNVHQMRSNQRGDGLFLLQRDASFAYLDLRPEIRKIP